MASSSYKSLIRHGADKEVDNSTMWIYVSLDILL